MSGGEIVVELGCGAGAPLDELIHCYRMAVGIDVSRRRLDERPIPQIGWKFILADMNLKIPLRSCCCDAVVTNQVIEHIADPKHFAQEIYRILRPGGLAVITTPNVRYIRHLWKLIVLGQGPRTAGPMNKDGPWDNGHIHYFTHSDLRSIFMEAGFKRVESQALVDRAGALSWLRAGLDRLAGVCPVREFLSGNIMVVAAR